MTLRLTIAEVLTTTTARQLIAELFLRFARGRGDGCHAFIRAPHRFAGAAELVSICCSRVDTPRAEITLGFSPQRRSSGAPESWLRNKNFPLEGKRQRRRSSSRTRQFVKREENTTLRLLLRRRPRNGSGTMKPLAGWQGRNLPRDDAHRAAVPPGFTITPSYELFL